jgi:hypothetical protein
MKTEYELIRNGTCTSKKILRVQSKVAPSKKFAKLDIARTAAAALSDRRVFLPRTLDF